MGKHLLETEVCFVILVLEVERSVGHELVDYWYIQLTRRFMSEKRAIFSDFRLSGLPPRDIHYTALAMNSKDDLLVHPNYRQVWGSGAYI